MKILISGSKGFIGTRLVQFLQNSGHDVYRLTRNAVGTKQISWDPYKFRVDPKTLEGFDAVINLAGESIMHGRWTEAKKKKIFDSRVQGTHLLSECLAQLTQMPKVLISGSAVGVYGDRGTQVLSEDSGRGSDFLGKLCEAWEKATQPAKVKGIRVVFLRLGVVLGRGGGAFAKLATPFKWGLGGWFGSGKQYMSWISLEDVVSAIQFILSDDNLTGPVNLVSPNPVTNMEFTRKMGSVLFRPALVPIPGFVLRLLLGDMPDSLLLSSARAEPQKLVQAGYKFKHPTLESALKEALR